MVELAAIGQERPLEVVELLERRLHVADVLTDGDLPAHLRLQVARARQMVRVSMRFENPLHRESFGLHVREHGVGSVRVRVSGFEVVVQDRVDDRCLPGPKVDDDIRDGPRLGIEERLNVSANGHEVPQPSFY